MRTYDRENFFPKVLHKNFTLMSRVKHDKQNMTAFLVKYKETNNHEKI